MQVERLSQGLQLRGCQVVVDVTGSADPSDFDIVHLYNFAMTEFTESLAKRAHSVGTPYVVTTLYEEVPIFHNQSHVVANHLFEYLRMGQDKDWWQRTMLDLSTVTKASRFRVDWIVSHAAALLTNGLRETAAIKRDFPFARDLVEVPLGHEVGAKVGPDLFFNEYGVRDFVLCVGRFETRKNQLMLLKALEDSDLTVVLASGGFSYQADYDAAVRNFKRKGRTVIVERLSPEMLSSAYAASRIHALPSWYELPGHVSIEAASHRKNIVVTDTGTQADYFGSYAFYCEPWNEDSIKTAVLDAFEAPFREEFVQIAENYSWENTVDRTLEVYTMIANPSDKKDTPVNVLPTGVTPSPENGPRGPLLTLIEQAEQVARSGDFEKAQQLVSQVAFDDPENPRVLKLQGIVHLAARRFDDAVHCFGRALSVLSGEEDLVTALRVGLCERGDAPAVTLAISKLLGTGSLSSKVEQPFASIIQSDSHSARDRSDRVRWLIGEAEGISSVDNFSRAHRLLDEALSIDPASARALRVKGTFLLAESNTAAAATFFQSSLERDPRDPRALTGFSLCQIAEKNFIGAYPFLVRAVKEDPHHLLALLGLVECSYVVGRFDDLIEALTRHIAVYGSDKEMRYCLAAALFKEGRVADAEREVAIVLRDDVSHRGAKELVDAIMSVRREQKKRAEESRDADMVGELGEIESLKRTQQYTAVLERCDQLLQGPLPNSSLRERILILKAESHALSGDEEDARALYSEVLETNPQSSRALSGQGALAAYRSAWDRAEELFVRARELDERNDSAWAGLGLCARNRSEWNQAWVAFSRALRINPENAGALYGAIDAGYQLGRLSDVEELIRAYLAYHPKDLEVQYALGECLVAQGRIGEAEQCLSVLGSFEPDGERFRQLGVRIAESRAGGDARR